MGADVEGNDGVRLDLKHHPQITLNDDGVNGPFHDAGKPVDLVRAGVHRKGSV